jgi:hypothetical protein
VVNDLAEPEPVSATALTRYSRRVISGREKAQKTQIKHFRGNIRRDPHRSLFCVFCIFSRPFSSLLSGN